MVCDCCTIPPVTSVPQREYNASDWWCHEDGLIAFRNEVIKYAYYRANY